MKITNIKKKNNKYEIKLEKGTPFLILDETILEFNLYKDKVINESDLEKIKNYDNVMRYYIKCVNKVKYKRRTKNEIISFLKKEDVSNYDIKIILDKLININLINDLDYLKAFINDEVNLTLNGPYKIKTKLYKKGFDNSDIDIVLDDIPDDVWDEKINKLIAKKIKSIRNKSGAEVKNKIITDLLKEGYNKNKIMLFINNYEFNNDPKVLEKQYNKLLRKYSKKDIDEKQKEYSIKMELYKKGYKEDEIKKTVK